MYSKDIYTLSDSKNKCDRDSYKNPSLSPSKLALVILQKYEILITNLNDVFVILCFINYKIIVNNDLIYKRNRINLEIIAKY